MLMIHHLGMGIRVVVVGAAVSVRTMQSNIAQRPFEIGIVWSALPYLSPVFPPPITYLG
jgi:hypothetical protein